MNVVQLTSGDFAAAVFSPDFVDAGFDREAIARIHRGEHDEWVTVLAGSGMFSNREVADMVRSWRANPRLLFDSLLVEADQVTKQYCHAMWCELDGFSSYDVSAA
ncbi:hypothetical protein BFN03_01540 [Rhodococcus sp. WMMA185]|uniref:hypothetical protein n=1 Tax=Rhodococcus sp. WMMA185 TaxID=679318 RepID=UPI000878A7E9|nr:hypothetical protein [Rhodococcus sp. WMMA185]AOW94259.1 hypothetical protein BFN03_01540 [Rhodococcus sp. WMMA185]